MISTAGQPEVDFMKPVPCADKNDFSTWKHREIELHL